MSSELPPTQPNGNQSNNQLPLIEFTQITTEISKHTHISISIRGETLGECRKHFDEIRKELV